MTGMMKKLLALCLIAMLSISFMAVPAMAQELETAPEAETTETLPEAPTDAPEEATQPEVQNYSPVLRVELTADKTDYETGETITWTVTVRNVSFFTAHDVVVTDELTDDIWVIGALYPGAALSFHTATEDAAEGEVWNTVTASWGDGDGIPDETEAEEVKSAAAQASVTVKTPAAPAAPVNPPAPYDPSAHSGEIDIFDEDVPLADVPLTADISALWLALSGLSACGAWLLGGKGRKDGD